LLEIHKKNRLMHSVNQYLATAPFDIYVLHLLQLVALHGSFTKAATQAGLTQSAITRQVQGVEARLGIPLFERTTRSVVVTDAGRFLLKEGSRLIGDLDAVLTRLREQFTDAPKEIRVGVSQTIGFSHLPGLFAAQHKRRPDVRLSVVHQPSSTLFSRLDANELDIAILCPPRRLPSSVCVTHRFDDAFTLILPPDLAAPTPSISRQPARWREWLRTQEWLLIHDGSQTGTRMRSWMRQRGWMVPNAAHLDSFDLIINLVALGQGISLVPQRALALYVHRRKVQRFEIGEKFTREIVVLTRRHPAPPPHIGEFVKNILF
jgi:DNA-binding transcriptional LysR family regulator